MPAATIVRSDTRDYWRWQAAVARRRATCLGYAYDADGTKKGAFTPWVRRTRRNPDDGGTMSVILGDDFLSKALDDYQQWTRAWWREAIQNCIDAGATRIDMTLHKKDGLWEVTVTDNGRGMTGDILFKKFLSLGSSGKKDSPTATGGFGEAKRLLLFPWCSWSILTNGDDGPIGVLGHGFTYKKVDFTSTGRGTKLIVTMPDDKHVVEDDAVWFVSKCWLPGVTITLNGTVLDADMKVGESIDSPMEDKLKLYYSPRARKARGFFIRKNGLLMYEKHTEESTLKGVLIGEIIPPSVEVLQSNRDALRFGEYRLDAFLQSLAKDTSSKLKKSKAERTMFRGTQRISATIENAQGQLCDILGKHFGDKKNKKISDQAKRDLDIALAALPTDMGPGVVTPTPGVASIILAGIDPQENPTEVEAAAQQLAWPADFYIVNDIDDYKVPKWLRPDGMEVRPRKLARLWTEFCRLILIRLGYKGKFGVGWILSENSNEKNGYSMAAYTRDQGTDWLLINPFIGGNIKAEKTYSLREPKHLNDVFAMALHECTHLVNGIPYHDESFSSALTENIGRVLPSTNMIVKIRDAVAARQEPADKQVEKASGMNDLVKIVMGRIDGLMHGRVPLSSVREVHEAAEGWPEVNRHSQRWYKAVTGLDPEYNYIGTNVRHIIKAMRNAGMPWDLIVRKLLETVPQELSPDKLSFAELTDVIAYSVWQQS